MMRTAFDLSFSILLALSAIGGCSSKDVDDGGNGSAGTAGASSASAGSGNSGGSGNNSSGSGNNSSGSGNNSSGSGNTAGSGGSGTNTAGTGGSGPACPTVCLDEMTVEFCDNTGAMMTANCTEIFAEDGLISNGCLSDATGEGCTIDDLADMGCAEGAAPFSFCNDLTEDDVLAVYVGCFHDMNGAHTVIPCYADFVMGTEEMPTIDCEAAAAECLP
jgi:hypothetical protein